MLRCLTPLALGFALLILAESTDAQGKGKKGSPSQKAPETATPEVKTTADGKVTVGDVTYCVGKSAATGEDGRWLLVLEATSKNGTQKFYVDYARAITEEGKTFEVKTPMGYKAVSLPEDVKIQIELKMGSLPKNVKKIARLELHGSRSSGSKGGGIPGLELDRGPKGRNVERPLVLKNVAVDRPE